MPEHPEDWQGQAAPHIGASILFLGLGLGLGLGLSLRLRLGLRVGVRGLGFRV